MTSSAMQGSYWTNLELSPTQRDKLDRMLSNEMDMMFRRRAFVLFSFLDLTSQDNLLECGCGRGFFLNMARGLSDCRMTGVELDDPVLEEAKVRLDGKGIDLLKADIQALPFESDSFSKILFTEVLEHIPDDRAALREVYRVLRPGGTVALSAPNANYPFLWDPINWTLETTVKRPIRSGILAGIWANHERLYTVQQLEERAREAGFIVEDVRPVTYFCVPFSHNVVYGIGKELLVAGLLPKTLSSAADRMTVEENSGSLWNPINAARKLFLAVDRLNDQLPVRRSSVTIAMKLRKPSAD